MRNWPEAIRALDRRRLAWPDEDYPGYSAAWERTRDQFYITGDLSVLERAVVEAIAAHPTDRPVWLRFAVYSTAMLKRDYVTAAESLAHLSQDDLSQFEPNDTKSFEHAFMMWARDPSSPAARDAFIVARDDCQARLAAIPGAGGERTPSLAAPDRGAAYDLAKLRALLALIYAYLGEKEQAVTTANQAVELFSAPAGSVEQNHIRAALALVFTQLGEPEKALDLIETLLKLPLDLPPAPYNLTIADLKHGWQWDPLRSNARFQKVLAQPEPSSAP
jgi:tetratricopeptide (TPR) repeat protein